MDEIEVAGGKAAVHVGDIGDPKAAAALAETALTQFGRIDILVNNAALRGELPFEQMSYADWRAVLDVTLDGAFHCTKACLPALKKSGGGRIINIGGLSAHTGAKDRAHVITAKAGLVGLTRALAHDLADDRITANCVVPGPIDTARPGTSQAGASPHPRHDHRRARHARRRRRHGAFSVRARRALHHRPDHPYQWRGFSRLIAATRPRVAAAVPKVLIHAPDRCPG